MNQATKEILIHIWKEFRFAILCVFATILIMANCGGCEHKPVNTTKIDLTEIAKKNDIIKQEFKEKRYKSIIDSLSTVKKKYYPKYIKDKKEAIKDTNHYVQEFIIDCDSLEIVNAFSIQYRDSIIDAKTKIISDKDTLIDIGSKRLGLARDSLKAEQKSRKKYFKGLKHGFFIGAVLVESANISSKFIK